MPSETVFDTFYFFLESEKADIDPCCSQRVGELAQRFKTNAFPGVPIFLRQSNKIFGWSFTEIKETYEDRAVI